MYDFWSLSSSLGMSLIFTIPSMIVLSLSTKEISPIILSSSPTPYSLTLLSVIKSGRKVKFSIILFSLSLFLSGILFSVNPGGSLSERTQAGGGFEKS